MVQLVWHVQKVEGYLQALDLAKKFRLYKTLTNLAYHSHDSEFYEKIHEIVDSGEYKIEWAIRAVFEQDK